MLLYAAGAEISEKQGKCYMLQVRKLVLAVAAATSMASSVAYALGLGEVTVKSALNEPLVAEIELLDTKGLSSEEIRSKLASAEDFSRAGVERQFFLNSLRFTPVVGQGGKNFVRVTSTQAVREPFLNFLLEVYWPAGRVLKEYTLLLDPPMYTPQEVVYSGAPVTAPAQTTTRVPESRTAPLPRSQPVPAAPQRPAAAPLSDSYRVQKNDTLWEIALRADRAGGSVHQTMLAIQDLNPDAFIDGNLNRLKSGQLLKLPNAEQIRQRSRQQAVTEFQAQEEAWRSGAPAQRQLDARRRETAAAAPAQVEQGGSLRLVATETGESQVGSDSGASNQSLENQLALTKEQLDSSLLQNQDLSSRVEELNSQVEKLQRLLELKNTQLAALQDMTDAEPAVTEAGEQGTSEPAEPAAVAVDEPEAAAEQPESLATEAEPVEAEPAAAAEATAEAAEETTEEAAAPMTEPAAEPAPQAEEPKPAPKPAPVVDPIPEPNSFLDELMENPLFLPGAGAGAALLLLLLLVARRNRAKQQEVLTAEEADDLTSQTAASSVEPESLDALDGVLDDLNVGTEEPAEFADVVADAADPISEAENYISFGRFNQAVDVLLEAIDSEPQRQDLRFKLLEVYADLEDHNAFQAQVSELSAMGVAQSELDALRARYPYLMGEESSSLSLDEQVLDLPAEPATAQHNDTSDLLSDDIPDLDDLLGDISAPATAPAFVEPDDAAAEETVSTEQDEFSSLLEAVEAELDADFNLDEVELSLESQAEPAKDNAADGFELPELDELSLESLGLDENELSLDDGFSLNDLQLENLEPTAQEETAFDLDFDLSLPLDDTNESAAASLDTGALELELESLGDSLGELQADAQEELQPATAASAEADTSVIELEQLLDLDSDLDLSIPTQTETSDNDDAMLAELDDDFSFLQGDDEDTTKLDLATAWIDMGDAEGAREILDEVLREGAPEHQERARELLAKLKD